MILIEPRGVSVSLKDSCTGSLALSLAMSGREPFKRWSLKGSDWSLWEQTQQACSHKTVAFLIHEVFKSGLAPL